MTLLHGQITSPRWRISPCSSRQRSGWFLNSPSWASSVSLTQSQTADCVLHCCRCVLTSPLEHSQTHAEFFQTERSFSLLPEENCHNRRQSWFCLQRWMNCLRSLMKNCLYTQIRENIEFIAAFVFNWFCFTVLPICQFIQKQNFNCIHNRIPSG